MSKIHWIARVAIRPAGYEAFRRDFQSRSATAPPYTVHSCKPVLQISPNEQDRAGGMKYEFAAVQPKLKGDHRDGIYNECPVGRTFVPASCLRQNRQAFPTFLHYVHLPCQSLCN